MYYKNVRRLADGRRVSQFIDPLDYTGYEMLEYKPNAVTKAPKGSNGVYCYNNLNIARDLVDGNTTRSFTGTVEIHIAHPIGKRYTHTSFSTFPAIKLGRTVAKHEVIEGRTRRF